jgi:glycosyltransferase involved in cell wall biosynthesis
MGDWPIRIVPNTLDVDRFQPLEKAFCRKALGLPQEPNLIAFGAIGGSQDPRKGFDLLFSAISCLSSNKLDRQTQCIIFGQSEPIDPPRLGIPMTYLGHLGDDYTLALVYSAADVVVVPSRQDNLPQTATEAHSCGRPVVAFDVGGMSDVVDDRVTGYLAKPFEPGDLAKGICWTIQDGDRLANLGREARKRALSLWVPETIVKQYLGVYEEATDAARGIK